MKKNEANIFLFMASIIIGVLIATNISFSRESQIMLSSREYQDNYAQKNKLINDISDLKRQYEEYSDKLRKYEESMQDRNKIRNEIIKEIDFNNEILGGSEVHGQGITITLNDASTEFVEDPFEYQLKLIHNTDMVQVINDLLNSGAEAISINGNRLIGNSSVYCNGPFLRVNGIQISAPFYIKAIGNKETLKTYMLADENYLKALMFREIQVDIEDSDDIIIPAFSGNFKNKFIKSFK